MLLFLDDLIFTRDLIPFQISEDLALFFFQRIAKNIKPLKEVYSRELKNRLSIKVFECRRLGCNT